MVEERRDVSWLKKDEILAAEWLLDEEMLAGREKSSCRFFGKEADNWFWR